MQYLFYDTCALLDQGQAIFNKTEKFYISAITLKELEHIKTSNSKDPLVQYKARKLIELLSKYEDKYELIIYDNAWDLDLKLHSVLSDNNDSRIILSAFKLQQKNIPILFITKDYCCNRIAAAMGLNVGYSPEDTIPYKGWVEIQTNSNIELEKIYNQIYTPTEENIFDLLPNQYLLLKDAQGEVIDYYKYDGAIYTRVPTFYTLDSKQFGKIKPKDSYQLIAMDSLLKNKITLLRGPAGSGKSYLSMAYLFHQLEYNNIDKIVIFCNTVAANGAAKLGFYPGSKDDKLLDSQIGNFLASKLGDKLEVERLIENGSLLLLPLADLRGFDTTGMKAGVYITEAQNMDVELMRLALQRIGEDCVCVLDGDSEAQVDASLYAGNNNGLRRVSQVFRGEDIYGEITLPNIYRSRIATIAQKL